MAGRQAKTIRPQTPDAEGGRGLQPGMHGPEHTWHSRDCAVTGLVHFRPLSLTTTGKRVHRSGRERLFVFKIN